MSFLNNINSAIGDQMRFLRDYKANPDKYKVPPKEKPPQDDSGQWMNPMMMMMMFMMMMKMMETMGINPGGMPGFPGFPPGGGFPPGLPPGIPPIEPGPLPPDGNINNNPAYKYIQDLLKNGGTTPAPGTPKVDFTSNDSLLKRINELLDKANDPQAREMFNQLKNIDPASNDAQTKLDALTTKLKADGLNDKELQELHLLIGAFTTNTVLTTLEQIRTLLPDPQLEARINDLKKLRDGFAAEWQKLYPPVQGEPVNLLKDVQQALELGKFTEEEMGQALKYLLDKAPADQLASIRDLLKGLFDSGQLNPVPFMTENYLGHLSDDRRNILQLAIRSAGVRMADGQVNSRLMATLLQSLFRNDNPQQQSFMRSLLQQWQDVYSKHPEDSPGRLTFRDFLAMANIKVDDKGQLVFPHPAPTERDNAPAAATYKPPATDDKEKDTEPKPTPAPDYPG